MSDQHRQTRRPGIGTVAIHGGHAANRTQAHVQPIYQSSTYQFDSVAHGQALWKEQEHGYIYGRLGNPNTEAAASVIAGLEGLNLPRPPFGLLAGSGMAAISTVLLALTQAGDTVISQSALYAATHSLLSNRLTHYGVNHVMFRGPHLEELDAALERHDNIKLVYIESPVNPTMALTDIRGVVRRAHAAGALVCVDNTFATPYLQRPFELGADLVVHSTTKYLAGHGTVVGGVVLTTDEALYHDRLLPTLITYGMVAGPMDAWLTEQGLKTFELRMARHCANGLAIARFLESHPAVSRVNYPGLPSFMQYELARTQMDDFGGMLSFELKGGYAAGEALMDHVQLCTLAVSLGAVDTLIAHPASMMNFKMAPEDRAKMGISDGLVRLSVGIENAEDIIADLEQALAAGSD